MTKPSNVVVRNEHTATAKEKPETYGLTDEEYVQFCRDLEACRNEKGRWDRDAFLTFAEKLLGAEKVKEIKKAVRVEYLRAKYLEEHDPLKINPWIKDEE